MLFRSVSQSRYKDEELREQHQQEGYIDEDNLYEKWQYDQIELEREERLASKEINK